MASVQAGEGIFTPPAIVEAVRAVLGAIDHDPASGEAANSIVRANRFFTKDANGVSKPWSARTIFTNPLYGKVGNK